MIRNTSHIRLEKNGNQVKTAALPELLLFICTSIGLASHYAYWFTHFYWSFIPFYITKLIAEIQTYIHTKWNTSSILEPTNTYIHDKQQWSAQIATKVTKVRRFNF